MISAFDVSSNHNAIRNIALTAAIGGGASLLAFSYVTAVGVSVIASFVSTYLA